ncbi:putative disease resistance protein At3g14460 [Arachis duranensis]|uniref:Disease resistance protein At3g14460 n=1 Tax=Arachis duranensis TaxID=130453 RepID=A0A9C6TFI2_ARADU|nr:putative disease resistance protein At3g14460 [Arachis duranensis]
MAEDLLRLPKRGESLEEVGSECFEELASRLFFKPAEYRRDRYVMHDLLHDLAIFLAGDFYCRLEELGEQEKKKALTRHLSHVPYRWFDHTSSKVFKSDMKPEYLRTSLYIDDLLSKKSRASKLKYLRVLSFGQLYVLPDSIGKLIHLRYLNLSGCSIGRLPESLCNLYNLQTLILYQCRFLTMLPNGMHKLVNLQHLDLRKTSLEEMPRGISKLKHMPILDYFAVGKHEDNGIQEFGGLPNLEGSFEIKKLENVVDVSQARSARMLEKNHIDKLLLEWSSGNKMVSKIETLRDILHNLQPHNGLKELTIKGYKGERFPDWVGHYSYNNMTKVSLMSCKNCFMLPSLGQLPSLKSLRIEGFDQLKRIGDEFYKNDSDHHSSPIAPFPSLEELVFDNMPCWEEWHVPHPEAFPRLRTLEIRNCPMLTGDMLNNILWRRVCCLREDEEGRCDEMVGGGDALSVRPSQSFNATTINHLRISGCPSIVSLSLDVFPNLNNLEIRECENLESVSMSEAPHAALQSLTISECPELVSLAGEGLAAPNLTHLNLVFCSKLEALPRDMKSRLPSLHSLLIYHCPNICRLAEGGLPPNLKGLRVGIGEQQMRDLSWMGNLHALTHLTIKGRECKNIKSYPEVGSLPHLPSLTTLQICFFHNLETLECNELLRLTSLQQLHIDWCPRLEHIEGETLPLSLLLLQIEQCGLLGEHCENKHKLIWPKISHIPTIEVNRKKLS